MIFPQKAKTFILDDASEDLSFDEPDYRTEHLKIQIKSSLAQSFNVVINQFKALKGLSFSVDSTDELIVNQESIPPLNLPPHFAKLELDLNNCPLFDIIPVLKLFSKRLKVLHVTIRDSDLNLTSKGEPLVLPQLEELQYMT